MGGWVGWSNLILQPTLALIRAQLGFRIQVRAEFGNIGMERTVRKDGGWSKGKVEKYKPKVLQIIAKIENCVRLYNHKKVSGRCVNNVLRLFAVTVSGE